MAGAEPIFVLEYLRSTAAQDWMRKHTKGVAVQGINLGDVKKIPIPLPSREVQRRFARKAQAVEKLALDSRASLFLLDELFSSLQHRAFNGTL